ncbi:large conductance mechanosensitive channel protein MscL [Advenella sp. WQ 585]|uniref:Large-conductance mechanosensitive channel n=1 Tax=Advenella mandrilli TaxID=2800330 RepID=A0ABS1EGV8_9BURK|nr:large conductance mechanosensitive channel protein MscL [Advenella mandrilli]MBK1782268.1 large conductance mechanosensitive channel protein MscL [Advenella mandrilli]
MSKAKGFINEFKQFAVKGNMIDLAVGVIIGAAFGKIIDSLVRDVMMPFINFILGGSVDFSNKFIILSKPEGYSGPETYAEMTNAGANVLAYGNFLTILINFILLAFVVFCLVKLISKARASMEKEKEAQAAAAPEPADIVLLAEIRDLLKNKH